MDKIENKYLEKLSEEFPTIQLVSTEIINLHAILNLPKGTEHFISDIHGASDSFFHFLRNGSGVIQEKIELLFHELSTKEKNNLAFTIYYPSQTLEKYRNLLSEDDFNKFRRENLNRIIEVCKLLSTKYTKSKIRKLLPSEFAYIIEELLFENTSSLNKERYYNSIIDAIFETDRANQFIVAVSNLISRLTIDRLHVVGDIYDRGPNPSQVMNYLMNYHSIDIEWGNHDILWMGAASGSKLSIANVIRICARYNNLDILEDHYGINLVPLATLAYKYYQNDDCTLFVPKNNPTDYLDISSGRASLVSKIHKAITIIQFKLEKIVSNRNSNFQLESRLLLDKINYDDGTILIKDKKYNLETCQFPTIDPNNPFELTEDELNVINGLKHSFLNNEKLRKEVKFLFSKGSMYLKYNNNLLFHGCVPLNDDGTFAKMTIKGIEYSGKPLFERFENIVRKAFVNRHNRKNPDVDYFVYLWQGCNSPLFGKTEMKTFERYFINDKTTHNEIKNPYFNLRENMDILKNIYTEFKLDFDTSKIINGHVPIEQIKGESPLKGNNHIYSIDGGLSKAYYKKTGIGGYTLIYNSYNMRLVQHEQFTNTEDIIETQKDIITTLNNKENISDRQYIYDTDNGRIIKEQINDLRKLLAKYRSGEIKPKKHE